MFIDSTLKKNFFFFTFKFSRLYTCIYYIFNMYYYNPYIIDDPFKKEIIDF